MANKVVYVIAYQIQPQVMFSRSFPSKVLHGFTITKVNDRKQRC